MQLSTLEDKRLSLWGFGREGQSTYRFLRTHFPAKPITVLTDKPLPAAEYLDDPDLSYVSGEDIPTALASTDVLIKSPGVSRYRPELVEFRAHGGTITTPTNIWLSLPRKAPVIAITGSNGKSTTVSLLHHMLNEVGFIAKLAGNIGMPLLEMDPQADCQAWLLELSSYQTADLYADENTQPLDVAAVLNLFPEHLQWHLSHDQYYRDKLHILHAPQTRAILNAQDAKTRELLPTRANCQWFNAAEGYHVQDDWLYHGTRPLIQKNSWPLKGSHNLVNLAAALTICQHFALDEAACLEAARRFPGLPHRLEYLGLVGRHQVVNDSNSKTPEATLAALDSLTDQHITLIAGGEDRKQDYSLLAREIVDRPLFAVITAYETGDRIYNAVDAIRNKDAGPELIHAVNLQDAVKTALEITPEGGLILLSPAAPSYDGFKNFEDRGDQFKKFIMQYSASL